MTTMASQITSLTVVYSTVYSDADHRKHQSSASLAFVRGIHRDRWIPRTKGQLRGKCFHLMTSSWDGPLASIRKESLKKKQLSTCAFMKWRNDLKCRWHIKYVFKCLHNNSECKGLIKRLFCSQWNITGYGVCVCKPIGFPILSKHAWLVHFVSHSIIFLHTCLFMTDTGICGWIMAHRYLWVSYSTPVGYHLTASFHVSRI